MYTKAFNGKKISLHFKFLLYSIYSTFSLAIGAGSALSAPMSSSSQSFETGESIASETVRIDMIILKENGVYRSMSFAMGSGSSGSTIQGESGYFAASGEKFVVDITTEASISGAIGTFSQVVVFGN